VCFLKKKKKLKRTKVILTDLRHETNAEKRKRLDRENRRNDKDRKYGTGGRHREQND
jgi:hypothetical protein